MKPLKLANACFSVACVSFVLLMVIGVGVRALFGVSANSAPRVDKILDVIAGVLVFVTVGAVFVYVLGWVSDRVRKYFR